MKNIFSQRRTEHRWYQASFDFGSHIQEVYDELSHNYCSELVGDPPQQDRNCVCVSDFWIEGHGGHSELGSKWGVRLPSDFLEFDRLFKHYTLVGRVGIHIWNADAVPDITQALRDGEGIPSAFPHRLYRFARVFGEPSHFMFRWDEDGTFRDIAFARYTDSTEMEILGGEAAIFSSDKDFSSWITRMVQSDGVPLHPPLSDDTDFLVQRCLG